MKKKGISKRFVRPSPVAKAALYMTSAGPMGGDKRSLNKRRRSEAKRIIKHELEDMATKI